ncbi:MAG: metal-dependent transcriptional regulator [Dehalococcoidales bacterium]
MNSSVEEYLKAIYNLTRSGKSASTSDVSKRLNISPASVTEMFKKLAEEGYISYSPYRGVTLTEKGEAFGKKMARKHRLLERFLHDTLKIGKDKVHEEACAMEHTLSDEVERALCLTLKYPDTCPDDGKTIPPCDFDFSTCQECKEWDSTDIDELRRRKKGVVSLLELKNHGRATVAFVRGGGEMLRRLCDMGLTPGTEICVTRIAPLKGPLEISVRGTKLALGHRIAGNIFVEKLDG